MFGEESARAFFLGWRRLSILILSPLMAGMHVQSARAANECGPDSPGFDILLCTGSSYGSGITYSDSDGLEVILANPSMTINGNGTGVQVHSSSSTTRDVRVTGQNFRTIFRTGNRGMGLFAFNRGLGGAHVRMDGGMVSTDGYAAYGLFSQITNSRNSDAASALLTGGEITTHGRWGTGAYALTYGRGAAMARMDGGRIISEGTWGIGIGSYIYNSDSTSTSMTLLRGGEIIITGDQGAALASWFAGEAGGRALSRMEGGTIEISGSESAGLYADVLDTFTTSSTATAEAVVTGGTVKLTGTGSSGIYVQNRARGLATATVSGSSLISATGTDADGIVTEVLRAGATYSINVTDSAVVQGGSGSGAAIRAISVEGSSGTVDIASGAVVDGTVNGGTLGMVDGAGDIAVRMAGTVTGDIRLGDGSDSLLVESSAVFSGVTLFDGGDDVSDADGHVDKLRFSAVTAGLDAGIITNWENVILGSGSAIGLTGTLTTGTLTVEPAALLDAGSSLAVDGSMTNAGRVDMADGTPGDTVRVTDDYSGGGTLTVDANLAAGTADTLVIGGNASGVTVLQVTDVTSGAASGSDVDVVQVGDAAHAGGSFVLAGGTLFSGIHEYGLVWDGARNWYVLHPEPSAVLSLYEALPHLMLSRMSYYSTRTASRMHAGRPRTDGPTPLPAGIRADVPLSGFWTRFSGTRERAGLRDGSRFRHSAFELQAGYDVPVRLSARHVAVLGLTGQLGRLDSAIESPSGLSSASIDGTYLGIGATATWLDAGGLYVDAQAQLNWNVVDMASSFAGPLSTNRAFLGMAAGLEAGWRIATGRGSFLVPQAQIMWMGLKDRSFHDDLGTSVRLTRSGRLLGRLGLAWEFSGMPGDGPAFKHYLMVNVLQELSRDTGVVINGAVYGSRLDRRTRVELGYGGALRLDGHAVLTMELRAAGTSRHDRLLTGNLGIQIDW